jgi:hypothetical protein
LLRNIVSSTQFVAINTARSRVSHAPSNKEVRIVGLIVELEHRVEGRANARNSDTLYRVMRPWRSGRSLNASLALSVVK